MEGYTCHAVQRLNPLAGLARKKKCIRTVAKKVAFVQKELWPMKENVYIRKNVLVDYVENCFNLARVCRKIAILVPVLLGNGCAHKLHAVLDALSLEILTTPLLMEDITISWETVNII